MLPGASGLLNEIHILEDFLVPPLLCHVLSRPIDKIPLFQISVCRTQKLDEVEILQDHCPVEGGLLHLENG